MNKATIIATLRVHEAELRSAGVVHLRLHGSVARGDHSAASDVDLIADFDDSRNIHYWTGLHLRDAYPKCSACRWIFRESVTRAGVAF